MNRNRKIILGLTALILSLAWTRAGFAGEGTSGDYLTGMGTQFGRGLWNIVSSPAEIPCTIASDMSVNSGTGFFTGFGKGTLLMLRRILVGASEIGTFMMPSEAILPPVCKKK